jgi:hypothetical protein
VQREGGRRGIRGRERKESRERERDRRTMRKREPDSNMLFGYETM